MTKAVISNRIYLKPVNNIHRKTIIDSLTHKIIVKTGRGKKAVRKLKMYKLLAGNILSIPRGRLDLIPEDYTIIDKTIEVPAEIPDPLIPLREDQESVYNEVDSSCFINAKVGWGKTFTALWIAYKLKQKTLIIVHTGMLRDQWSREVIKLFGITPGVVGGNEYNIDSPIVIGTIQTLTKYTTELCKEFGTIIVDEGHHTPANTFLEFIEGSYAKYRIALSGTLERVDGAHVMFRDIFGDKMYAPTSTNTLDPKVTIYSTTFATDSTLIWADRVTKLLQDEEYLYYVAALAADRMISGHKVLIIADRTDFLIKLKGILGEDCLLAIGTTSSEEKASLEQRLESGEASCIAGARKIFTEGLSINILSCVILATPIGNEGNLTQIIGRIQRIHDNKQYPEVIDINLNSYSDRERNKMRTRFYYEQGWEVRHV